jgi:hypothetical protein
MNNIRKFDAEQPATEPSRIQDISIQDKIYFNRITTEILIQCGHGRSRMGSLLRWLFETYVESGCWIREPGAEDRVPTEGEYCLSMMRDELCEKVQLSKGNVRVLLFRIHEHQDRKVQVPLLRWWIKGFKNENGDPRIHPTLFDLSVFLAVWMDVDRKMQEHQEHGQLPDRHQTLRQVTREVLAAQPWRPTTRGPRARSRESLVAELQKRIWAAATKEGHREGIEQFLSELESAITQIREQQMENFPSISNFCAGTPTPASSKQKFS